MLRTETVSKELFAILKQLQHLNSLSGFAMAGGTALALKYGHRISVDINLFGEGDIHNEIIPELDACFGNEIEYAEVPSGGAVFAFIKGVKVDIIPYDHPLIYPKEEYEDIRFLSSQDICAMKIGAILGRGAKKDFWDISELLDHFSLEEMIGFYKRKYPKQRLMITVPQALTYFDDAENSPSPKSIKNIDWDSVKEIIRNNVRAYLS